MINTLYYQVGLAESPDKNDPVFDTAEEAEKAALDMSENLTEGVYAVWQVDGKTGNATTELLIFEGSVWSPSP